MLTFDWYYIVSTPQLGNVLTIPFVYVANLLLGNILFYWTLTPIFSSINAFKHPNLINLDGNEISPSSMYADDGSFYNNVCSASLFNSSGLEISATDLYDSEFNLDLASYHQQAPIYITDMFAMDYFSSFLVLSAMLSHVALWHGKQIAKQFRGKREVAMREQEGSLRFNPLILLPAALKQVDTPDDQLDIHNKLMKAYPDVPEWMYLTFLAVCTVAMCLVGVFTPFSMPVWAVLLAVFIAAATILPTGIIFAITGTQIGLNVLSEMVIGFILPGQTVTVMAFKSLCYNCQIQAFMLVADLKISHYLKIPPRAMVIAQLYATLLGSIACLTASWFVMVSPFAQSIGTGPWKANQQHIFFSAGAIWGAIAPMRFFGPDSPYFLLLSGFAIGLVCPVIPWALHKWRPDIKLWKMINFPLIFFVNGTGSLRKLSMGI